MIVIVSFPPEIEFTSTTLTSWHRLQLIWDQRYARSTRHAAIDTTDEPDADTDQDGQIIHTHRNNNKKHTPHTTTPSRYDAGGVDRPICLKQRCPLFCALRSLRWCWPLPPFRIGVRRSTLGPTQMDDRVKHGTQHMCLQSRTRGSFEYDGGELFCIDTSCVTRS